MKRECKSYESKLKASVAIEALEGKRELLEIATRHKIPKSTIHEWKDRLINHAIDLFKPPHERDKQIKQLQSDIEGLHKIIGEITIENNFLKKKLSR